MSYDNTSYICDLIDKTSVTLLRPILDKLHLNLYILDEDEQGEIESVIVSLIKDTDSSHWQPGGPKVSYGSKFAINCKIVFPGKRAFAVVRARPKNTKSMFFLRLEFNPQNLGYSGIQFLKEQLDQVFLSDYGITDLLKSAKISRCDFAVDILNLPLNEILMTHSFGGKGLIFKGVNQVPETIYGGRKKRVPYSAYIYDKLRELLDKGKTPWYGETSLVRLEIRRPNAGLLSSIAGFNNPLKKVRLYCVGNVIPPGPKYLWELFLRRCQLDGVHNAIAGLPAEVRPHYALALEESSKSLWRPETLWQSWPQYVESLGLFEGKAFQLVPAA